MGFGDCELTQKASMANQLTSILNFVVEGMVGLVVLLLLSVCRMSTSFNSDFWHR